MRARIVCFLLVAGLGPALSGCGVDHGDKVPVVGTITIQGQPVAEGTINFASASPAEPVFTGSLIKDGQYAIPAEQGLPPGTYIVRISSAEPGAVAADPLPGESGPPLKDRVPPQYNALSNLQFQVEPGRQNTFDFDVP